MKSFNLVPNSTLELITEKLYSSFQLWVNEWSVNECPELSISTSNAFENTEYENDTFYEYASPAGLLYLSSENLLTKFLGGLILNQGFPNVSDRLNNTENKISQYVVNASVVDYFNRVFSNITKHNIEKDNDEYINLFKKGNGVVLVTFSSAEFKAEFLLPQHTYEEIVPVKNYKRQVSDFGKIDITKLNNKINVSATLNKTKLNVKDLMELSNGDYLVLEHKVDDDVNLLKEGQLIAKCRLGVNDYNKAIQITN